MKIENIELLVEKFKKGDQSAFKEIFVTYQGRLSSFINGYTNNYSLTQDIVQDSFIKLWEGRNNISDFKSIGSYLYKIAFNTFIDTCRKNKKEYLMLDSLIYKKMNEMLENEDNEFKENRIQQIKNSIETLPPKCKEIFIMSKMEGMRYSEIADALNISIKTVESQMRKAFITIRKNVNSLNSLFLFLNFFIFKKLGKYREKPDYA